MTQTTRTESRRTKSLGTFALLLLAILSLSTELIAQTPIDITLTISPPYSNKLSDYNDHPERFAVIIRNDDTTRAYDIRLQGTIENLNGTARAVTKDNYPADPIRMAKGEIKVLDGNALSLFNPDAITVTGASRSEIIRTGLLPEGQYSVCLRAIEISSGIPLSQDAPYGCSGFGILFPEAPQIVYPPCGDTVIAFNPQMIRFQWNPPAANLPGDVLVSLRYEFAIVAVRPGENSDDALRYTPLYEKKDMVENFLLYGPSQPQLRHGTTYAWFVRVYDPLGRTGFQDNGWSVNCTFIYKDPLRDGQCQFPEMATVFPAQNLRYPFRTLPVIAKPVPYCGDYRLFQSNFELRKNGSRVEKNSRTVNWPNGPVGLLWGNVAPTALQATLATNIAVNNSGHNLRKAPTELIPRKTYKFTTSISLTSDGAGSSSGPSTVTGTLEGTFSVGMSQPKNVSPADGARVPPGMIPLTFNTGARPADAALVLPVDINAAEKTRQARGVTVTPSWSNPRNWIGGEVAYPVNEVIMLEVSDSPQFTGRLITLKQRIGDGVHLQAGVDPAVIASQLFKDTILSIEVTMPGTYHWRVKWLVNPDSDSDTDTSAYAWSPSSSFVVDASADCVDLQPLHPRNRVDLSTTNRPQFGLVAMPQIDEDKIDKVRLQIWRMNSANEDPATTMAREPLFDETKSDMSGQAYSFRADSAGTSPFDLPFINNENSALGDAFTAVDGDIYLWRTTLVVLSNRIRKDGTTCSSDTLRSVPSRFTYNTSIKSGDIPTSECVRLEAKSPAPDEIIDNTLRPSFSLGVMPHIDRKKIESIRLQIWTMTTAASGTPLFDETSIGRGLNTLKLSDVDADEMALDLMFVNREGSAFSFRGTDGEVYVWKATVRYKGNKIRLDGKSCNRDSSVVSGGFTIRLDEENRMPTVSASDCLKLTALTPSDGTTISGSSQPPFEVVIAPEFNVSGVTGGRIKLWEIDSLTQERVRVMLNDPVFNRRFDGNDATLLKINLEKGMPGGIPVELPFVWGGNPNGRTKRARRRPPSFRLQHGKSYLWQLTLNIKGDSIRSDGVACKKSSILMEEAAFRYDTTGGGDGSDEPCIDGCSYPAPTLTDATDRSFKIGDTVSIGGFTLHLGRVLAPEGSSLGGTGWIKLGFIPRLSVAVHFSGLVVNDANQVVSGTVYGAQDAASPLSEAVANGLDSSSIMDNDAIKRVYGFVRGGGRLASMLTGFSPTHLPIGIDNNIDGAPMTIGVIGMVFEPTSAYLNAVMALDIPSMGPGAGLGFGARNICFSPTGFGDTKRNLYLARDLPMPLTTDPGSFRFVFKAPTLGGTMSQPVTIDSGSYVSWDCKGFQDARLMFEVEFPRSWMIPVVETADGKDSLDQDPTSQVKASFYAQFRRNNNFLVSGFIGNFAPTAAPDWHILAQEIVYDESVVDNPFAIIFPEGYTGDISPAWQGFFIQRAQLRFPPELAVAGAAEPPVANISNLLIDRSGLTLSAKAINAIPQANFGAGWRAMVDTVGLDIASSSLTRGYFTGNLDLPVSDQPIDYHCELSRVKADSGQAASTSLVLELRMRDTLDIDLWKAGLKFQPGARIEISKTGGQRLVQATISGDISFKSVVGDIPGVELRGITFEGLGIRSVSPHFLNPVWRFASPQKGVSGFPLSINSMEIENDSDGDPGVKVAVSINLQPGAAGFSGGTNLKVYGKQRTNGKWRFKSAAVDSIGLRVVLAAGSTVEGTISLYRGDSIYGNGFYGSVQANIINKFGVAGVLQVGSVKEAGNTEKTRYWMVDAKTYLARGIPIPGISALSLYGFGGALSHHMKRNNNVNPQAPRDSANRRLMTPGTSLSGYVFSPDASTGYGFRAMVTLGTTPTPDAFNCDAAVEAELTNSGGLSRLTFQGSGYMAASLLNRRNAKISGTADFTYTPNPEVFHGSIAMNVNAPPLTGNGQCEIHIEPSQWYLKLGNPYRKIKMTIAGLFTGDGYLMVGNNLPTGLQLPPEVAAAFPDAKPGRASGLSKPGDALIFGKSFSYSTGEKKVGPFYGEVDLGAGFDVSLQNYDTATCNGSSIGINGWYANGQIYAWLDAKVGMNVDVFVYKGRVSIFNASLKALATFGGPNPFWGRFDLSGRYSVLSGAVKGRFHYKGSIGAEACVPSATDVLASMEIIADVSPPDGAKDVSVFASPKAAFNIDINPGGFDLTMMSDTEDVKTTRFRINLEEFSIKPQNMTTHTWGGHTYYLDGNPVESVQRNSEFTSTLTPRGLLEASEDFIVRVRVKVEEKKGNRWVAAKDSDGNTIVQSATRTFTSGARPDAIPDQNVRYTYPLQGQRYFMKGEGSSGSINLDREQDYLFGRSGGTTYHARFTPVAGGSPLVVNASYTGGTSYNPKVTYTIPSLSNSTIYRLEIIRRTPQSAATGSSVELDSVKQYENRTDTSTIYVEDRAIVGVDAAAGSPEDILYTTHFRTSRYNTGAEKITALRPPSTDPERHQWAAAQYGHALVVRFEGDEGFDLYEVDGVPYTQFGTTIWTHPAIQFASTGSSSWHTDYYQPKLQNRGPLLKAAALDWINQARSKKSSKRARLTNPPGTGLGNRQETWGSNVRPKLTASEIASGNAAAEPSQVLTLWYFDEAHAFQRRTDLENWATEMNDIRDGSSCSALNTFIWESHQALYTDNYGFKIDYQLFFNNTWQFGEWTPDYSLSGYRTETFHYTRPASYWGGW